MLTVPRRSLLGGTAASVALPRFAIAQADTRPTVTVAVQTISTSNTLDDLREQSNVGTRLSAFYVERLIGLNYQGQGRWERHARIARGLAIASDGQGYAANVRNLGAGALRVYGAHVLPNIASTLIVSATLAFPEIILLESGLSFLGLGVQPPLTSLGNMVGYAREYLQTAPWILLAPGLTIVLTTLCIGLVGDWLRDRLDPTLE